MKLKKMEVNFYGLLVLFFLLITALANCPGLAAAEEEKILNWGTFQPLSGPAAMWGKAMNQGVELAADEFNAKGGLKVGNTRYKIKILAEDDKYTGGWRCCSLKAHLSEWCEIYYWSFGIPCSYGNTTDYREREMCDDDQCLFGYFEQR